ncbi:MAG: toll/interleukin-1 receptor domain-containing protein, partial [Gammaproteobacteria bacterium]
MATVFVSHAGEDRALAIELHQWLLEEGHEVFLAHDLHDGIGVGEEWQQRLHERLRWAQVVVCLLTSAYAVSPWCTAELGGAQTRGSRILPVAAEPGVTHPLLRSVQHVDMTRDPAGARLALAEALRRVDLAARRRIRTLLVAAASAIVVFLGGGAGLVTILSASTTDSPDVRARSKNGAGSAEFSWE